jgi:hypothetical protein
MATFIVTVSTDMIFVSGFCILLCAVLLVGWLLERNVRRLRLYLQVGNARRRHCHLSRPGRIHRDHRRRCARRGE